MSFIIAVSIFLPSVSLFSVLMVSVAAYIASLGAVSPFCPESVICSVVDVLSIFWISVVFMVTFRFVSVVL